MAKKDNQFIVSAFQRGSSHKGERGQLSERTASESMGLVLDVPSAIPPGLGCLSTAYPIAASPKRATVEPILAPE
jgi:hypothetical protein